MQLVVIAKEPVPGKVKTRLCPPFTFAQAAAVAEAGLSDTLRTVMSVSADRHVLALDGSPGSWVPDGYDVIPQRGAGLDERLAAAFSDCFSAGAGPVVLVGMDTPQVTADQLRHAAALLDDHDAVIGPAPDGGYWLVGFQALHDGAIEGVPMSAEVTFIRQMERLASCGCKVALTDSLRDVDQIDDAMSVAAAVPQSRFAAAVNNALATLASGRGRESS